MAYSSPLWRDKLRLLALLALFNAGSSYVRVLLRAAVEGPAFQWSFATGVRSNGEAAQIVGRGLDGDVEPLLLGAGVVVWLFYLGLRGPERLFAFSFAGWSMIKLGVALWTTARLGQDLRISMETIGVIDQPAAWFTLPPLVVTWLLAIALLVRAILRPASALSFGWLRPNTGLTALAAGALLGSALALNAGAQNGSGDLLGVILIYAALMLLIAGVAPWRRRTPELEPG